MLTRHKPRSRRSLYVFRAVILLFGVYLAYHAFHGDHGLLAHAEVQERVTTLETELVELTERREHLMDRVEAMGGDDLDGDLIDQHARQMLGLIGTGERILRP